MDVRQNYTILFHAPFGCVNRLLLVQLELPQALGVQLLLLAQALQLQLLDPRNRFQIIICLL